MVIMIDLPDGCSPGSAEAIKYFSEQFDSLQKTYPGANFQFMPFSFKCVPGNNNTHVTSIMAVAL